ncbi:MAG: hypothetical protein HOB44_05235 [Gammaproteobacteria bacterium]|nr:hypothetical protein [Gammaproteobacteria bacterium]
MLISIMSSPLAGYLDDWTDEALCGWMEQPSPPEYIVKEVKKRAIFCNNALLVDSKASSDKSLNVLKNSGIKIYNIIFSDEIKEELTKLVPIDSSEGYINLFKNYELAYVQDQISCSFNIKKASYDKNYEGTIQNREIANGSIYFKGTNVTFDGQWKMGGLSKDPKYFNEEVDIKLTNMGYLVGKMAYFNDLVEEGEAPEKPLFIALSTHPNSKALNYKIDPKWISAEIWINIGTSEGGVLSVFDCRDRKQIEKENKSKEKLKTEFELVNLLYSKDEVSNLLSIDYLDGIFESDRAPEDSKKLHDDELHKAHISGMIEINQLDKNFTLWSLASTRESEEYTVLVLITNEFEIEPLKDYAKPSIEHCGKLPGWWWDKLSFVISTTDIDLAKKQKCYFDFFANNADEKANILYKAILSASPSIVSYLKSSVDR